MLGTHTKSVILDTAEQLFSEHGFSEVSLRRIIAVAGVNLASVHYHFGSKEALIEAILARRIKPLNQERLACLAKAERKAGKAGASLPRILEALIGPTLRLSRDTSRGGDRFVRLRSTPGSSATRRCVPARVPRTKAVFAYRAWCAGPAW